MTAGTDPGRRARMARIAIGVQAAGLEDDDARALFAATTGETSRRAMTDVQLDAVIDALAARGAYRHDRADGRRRADGAHARKARALWLSLYYLAEIEDGSERALAAFARRQCRIDALQWVDAAASTAVIEALKGWLRRAGVVPPDDDRDGDPWRRAVLTAQYARLVGQRVVRSPAGLVGWLEIMGYPPLAEIGGRQADAAIRSLGEWLRAAAGKRVHHQATKSTK